MAHSNDSSGIFWRPRAGGVSSKHHNPPHGILQQNYNVFTIFSSAYEPNLRKNWKFVKFWACGNSFGAENLASRFYFPIPPFELTTFLKLCCKCTSNFLWPIQKAGSKSRLYRFPISQCDTVWTNGGCRTRLPG